jgi:hypothetical protein
MKNKELGEFFGRDERTIRRWKQEGMPAHDASAARQWWLENKHGDPKSREPGDIPLDTIEDRFSDWRELYCGEPVDCMEALGFDHRSATVEDLAPFYGDSPQHILTCLRLGAPYVKRGNFETGQGFRLHFTHFMEWHVLLLRAAILGKRGYEKYDRIINFLESAMPKLPPHTAK